MGAHCISFYEENWLVRAADRQQWNHVTGAFDCTYQLYNAATFVWDDAVHNPNGLPVYLFDESGQDSLTSVTLPDDAVLVFGITGMNDVGLVPAEKITGVIRIDTPMPKSLWGCEAAAIALAHRYQQSVS